MNITMIPIGSRGDVQPFVALGCQLQSRGHVVRIATHARFADFVRCHGLDFFLLGGDPEATLQALTPRLTSRNPLESVPAILEVLSQIITPSLRGIVDAIEDRQKPCDAVIASYPALFAGIEAAQRRGIPLLLASLYPVTPTAAIESVLMPPPPAWAPAAWQRLHNRLSHITGPALIYSLVRPAVDDTRKRVLGWGPCPEAPIRTVHKQRLPILCPFSPTLIARPPDWPEHVQITGHWYLDANPDWQPPAELRAFLDAGPPPLYVGFGSMGEQSLPVVRELALALSQRRQRTLLYLAERGDQDLHLPEHILPIGVTPFSWLFPRTAGAIHHGGLGTISEGLRTGIPQGLIHFSVEQAFWARAANRIGVAPPALPARGLNRAAVDALLDKLLCDSALRQRAAQVAVAVAGEHGTENAAAYIERWLSHR